jgi:hypothetical protein
MLRYTILLFSLPNYTGRIGLSEDKVEIVGAMVNLGMAVGRPVLGYYGDSVGSVNMATGATLFGSLLCFVWMFAKSYGVLALAAILAGSVCGTFWAVSSPSSCTLSVQTLTFIDSCSSGQRICGLERAALCPFYCLDLSGDSLLFAEPIALSLGGHAEHASVSVQSFTGAMFFAGTLCLLLLRNWKVSR